MNTTFYNLSFGRQLVLIHDYFPHDVYSELLKLTTTTVWENSKQANRQSSEITNQFVKNVAVTHIEMWTGKPQKFLFCCLWKDTEGLEYPRHTDKGLFSKRHNHIQIYLNEGESINGMGTRFHHSIFHRKPTLELSYTGNAGYFINRSQTVFHSVAPVPKNKVRYSLYARFEPL